MITTTSLSFRFPPQSAVLGVERKGAEYLARAQSGSRAEFVAGHQARPLTGGCLERPRGELLEGREGPASS